MKHILSSLKVAVVGLFIFATGCATSTPVPFWGAEEKRGSIGTLTVGFYPAVEVGDIFTTLEEKDLPLDAKISFEPNFFND